jgi:hypothetical protein
VTPQLLTKRRHFDAQLPDLGVQLGLDDVALNAAFPFPARVGARL